MKAPRIIFSCLCLALPQLAHAEFADTRICGELQASALLNSSSWFGIDEKETSLTPLWSGVFENRDSVFKIAYVHKRTDDDSSSTVMLVKIRYNISNNITDKDSVALKNNVYFKRVIRPLSVYQTNGVPTLADWDIETKFHLREGRFSPLTTGKPDSRLRKAGFYNAVATPEGSDEYYSFRAYLLRLSGIDNKNGSCVDFESVIIPGTWALDIDIVDLKSIAEGDSYYEHSIRILVGNSGQ